MATVNINATLTVAVSTSGFSAVQPSSPTQLYTPSTGQRAFTLADTITAMNEQINAQTDATTALDSPDTLYNFQVASDGIIIIDAFSVSATASASTWDGGQTYIQGVWQ